MGLPYSWLTASGSSPYRGYCVPHTQDASGVGALTTRGEVWCPHIQRYRLYAFLKELSGPSFFSQHHRLSYPHSDDLFLRSLLKDSLAFTRPLFTRGRFRFVAKLSLGHYSWLRTLPLPGTHAGVGDRLGHEPGVVLRLPTQCMRFAHRTMSSKNITNWSLKKTTGSIEGRPPPA